MSSTKKHLVGCLLLSRTVQLKDKPPSATDLSSSIGMWFKSMSDAWGRKGNIRGTRRFLFPSRGTGRLESGPVSFWPQADGGPLVAEARIQTSAVNNVGHRNTLSSHSEQSFIIIPLQTLVGVWGGDHSSSEELQDQQFYRTREIRPNFYL